MGAVHEPPRHGSPLGQCVPRRHCVGPHGNAEARLTPGDHGLWHTVGHELRRPGRDRGHGRVDIADRHEAGLTTSCLDGGRHRWAWPDADGVYGAPTIAHLKATPHVIHGTWGDPARTDPSRPRRPPPFPAGDLSTLAVHGGSGVRRAAAEPLERLRHRRASAAAGALRAHIGAIFGGMVPPIVTLLAGYHHMGLASAMLAGIVVGAISFCLALLAGPETKGTRFDPDIVVD
jgi:hypothetical protein